MNVDYGEQGTALAFVENSASWHKQCHQKFNNSKLERVKQRLQKRKRSSEKETLPPHVDSSVSLLKYIGCAGYFFAFDHYNYARWFSVHISDMSSLSASFRQEFQNNWVVSKTQHGFSSIPIDQAHE